MAFYAKILLFALILISFSLRGQHVLKGDSLLSLGHIISGKIAPKSIVASGQGLFFAQNMMYRHTVTVYDQKGNLIQTIKDKVKLSDFGFDSLNIACKGAPVECVFSQQGKYAWISNYSMTGPYFSNPGCDTCTASGVYDSSFVYKINTSNFDIEAVVKVGAVPKFMAVDKTEKLVFVSNWSSGDISVIDTDQNIEVKRIKVGAYPRGLVVDKENKYLYVALMGTSKICKIQLDNFEKSYLKNIGKSPRHLCLSEISNKLYATLNGDGKVVEIDLNDNSKRYLKLGRMPRSMVISKDETKLYVVNYGDNSMSVVDVLSWKEVSCVATKSKPIGVTVDKQNGNIWVACYSGNIMIFSELNEPVVLNRDSRVKVQQIKPVEDGKFYLIAGSFKELENALTYKNELHKKYEESRVLNAVSKKLHYVSVAEAETKEAALEIRDTLLQLGLKTWVFKL